MLTLRAGIVLAIGAAFAVSSAAAQTSGASSAASGGAPLFEIGILGVGGTFPDYPGSSQNHFHALPFPYIVYRGKYFQLAGRSASGIVYRSSRVSFDISASGSFDTHSSNDTARAGMPGLDYLGEIGPRLNILLAHDATDAKVDLELPVRAVLSTDFKSLAYRGWTFSPEIAYSKANFMDTGGQFKLGLGTEFATQELMDYFYQVQSRYVIPGVRAAYNASAGYLGSRVEASFRYPLNERVTLYSLGRVDFYQGATNAGSPLFKRNYNYSLGLGFSFSFYHSDATADGVSLVE